MDARSEIARERRRMMQVREAFRSALDSVEHFPADTLATFYSACAEYVIFSLARLYAQDQLIHDLLKARIPATDRDAHARLDDLANRQARSRVLVDEFAGATGDLAAAGVTGVAVFESAARQFSEQFSKLLAPRKNPFHTYTDELFDAADWTRIAAVTDASLSDEAALFAAVEASAPQGIDPASMPVRHA